MATVPSLDPYRRALAALQGGELRQAERLLKQLAAAQPKHFAALNLLAVLLTRAEKFAEAESYIQRALNENASSDVSFYNYGIILKALKRPGEALEQFSQALKINAAIPETWNNRGTTFKDLGRYREAVADFDKAISLNANYAEAYCNKASALAALERYQDALAVYGRALSLKPDLVEAWLGRGITLIELKLCREALADLYQALNIKPDLAEAWTARGNAHSELGEFDDALAAYDRALALKDLAGAWLGRGYIFAARKRREDALAAFDKASSLKPDLAEAWVGRGNIFKELKRYSEALAAYDCALSIKPDLKFAGGLRLQTKMQLCHWADIEADFRQIISIISNAKPLSPFVSLPVPLSSALDQLNCARVYVANQPTFQALWRGDIYSHERINIAYLSADFDDHPVALLTVGLFELHDRSRFQVTAISYGPERESALRKRIRDSAEHFLDASRLADREIAEMIRGREIDIAVDLMGFTENNRFGVLARRPAPIQVNYLGYPATMGAGCIDYILADATIIPKGQQKFYSEQVVWLPDSYQVNDRRRPAAQPSPNRRDCGLPDGGFVFCAFNSTYKIAPAVFDIWMRLLAAVDGSVLWLRQTDEATLRNLCREAEHRGVGAERLIFAPYAPDYATHLARHRLADLFLDTLPYNAHTTASDALWAGIPVLTCLGATFAGRVAASLLRSIGLDELIVRSLDEYEALAIRLAREPTLLQSFKERLEHNRNSFPLFDAEGATRHIEAAYTTMWRCYQSGDLPKVSAASGTRDPIQIA